MWYVYNPVQSIALSYKSILTPSTILLSPCCRPYCPLLLSLPPRFRGKPNVFSYNPLLHAVIVYDILPWPLTSFSVCCVFVCLSLRGWDFFFILLLLPFLPKSGARVSSVYTFRQRAFIYNSHYSPILPCYVVYTRTDQWFSDVVRSKVYSYVTTPRKILCLVSFDRGVCA